MTQGKLAEKLNVSRQNISKWDQGSVYPEIERLIEICELFQCSIDQILREDMILNYEALRSTVIVANR